VTKAVLTINSRNYGAWSMRTWLLCRLSKIDFDVRVVAADDPSSRAELLQLSPSFLVPFLEIDGFQVWDTLAIAEVLHECNPAGGLLPAELPARAHCRSICGELHSGFANLRSAMPMNIKRRFSEFKVWSGVEFDIGRITTIWTDCLGNYGGPWLFGPRPTVADAMFAPEVTRFRTYGVALDATCQRYADTVLGCAEVQDWINTAIEEEDMLVDLEGDF
jgi:glutathione S-transferase